MALPLFAQDITSVFLSVPEDVLFGTDAEGKNKLVSNPKDSVVVEVATALNGKVKRLEMSDDFIVLETSSAGTLQVKLLPLINNSHIVCVINTVCGKACSSHIQFYTTNWIPLNNTESLFPELNSDLFIKSDIDRSCDEFLNAFAALDMLPMKTKLNPDDTSLKIYFDIENYLTKSDFEKIQPFLIDSPKVFNWDKISYK